MGFFARVISARRVDTRARDLKSRDISSRAGIFIARAEFTRKKIERETEREREKLLDFFTRCTYIYILRVISLRI